MKLLPLAFALLVCTPRRIPPAPAAGWQEYQSEHFILDTDVSRQDAETIMGTFESLRAADLLLLAGAHADYAGHLRLFVPADPAVFYRVAPAAYAGAFYAQGVPNAEPMIVAPASYCLNQPQVVAHELAHAISHYLYPQQKSWYAEGLAQFVETLGRTRARNIVPGRVSDISGAAGEILPRAGGFIHGKVGILSGAKLLEAGASTRDARPEVFYDSAWLLYHWLWNTQGKKLAAFQQRLSQGEGWDDAWSAVFPELNPARAQQMDALDESLASYRRDGRFRTAMIEVQADFTVLQRPFTSMRYWVALLRKDWPKNEESRRLEQIEALEEARAEDPSNAGLLAWLASLKKKSVVETTRAIAQGAPDQFAGWLALGRVTADPAEKERALRRAVALGPDCAGCNNSLASLLAKDGRAQEALAYSNRAVDLAPWSSSYVDTLAEVAVGLKQCENAEKLQARALRMAVAADRPAAEYEKRLASLKERCAAR